MRRPSWPVCIATDTVTRQCCGTFTTFWSRRTRPRDGTTWCSTHAVKELPQNPAGYDCVNNATVRELKGGEPRTDHSMKGDDSDPGLASRRGCVLTATTSSPEAVGWAPLVGRPAYYFLPGTVGQWWSEGRGGDPKTDQVTQGADSELPGWQPKENAT